MIVIAGKNNIAVHALEVLVSKCGISNVSVIPNKTDMGVDGWQRSLKGYATSCGVKILDIASIGKEKVDLLLSLEYDQLINPVNIPTDKIYNIHFSALPKYKGMYTSVWPILNGENTSGVTLHKIDKGIDTGPIVDQRLFGIDTSDRCGDLYRKYIYNSIKLFDENIDSLLSDQLIATAQDSYASTYFSKKSIDFKNITIDFNCTAWQLQRQIYAYTFREYQIPKVFGKAIVEVEITKQLSCLRPGTFFDEDRSCVKVACIDYDAIIYFDNLDIVLKNIKKMTLSDTKNAIRGIAGVHDRNSLGWSPIIVAAYNGNKEVIEYLLSIGADVNDTNYKGTSVLMYAKNFCIQAGDNYLFKYLIGKGADADIVDYSGKKIVDYLSEQEIKFLGL